MEHDFDSPHATPFARALDIIAPGASSSQLAPLFENKVDRTTIAHWRNGRRGVPQWAIDILRTKIQLDNEQRLQRVAQIKTGPGKRAGAINIKKWNAANPR